MRQIACAARPGPKPPAARTRPSKLHLRNTSPAQARGDSLPAAVGARRANGGPAAGIFQTNAEIARQCRRLRHGQAAGRAARLRLGPELDRGRHRPARSSALEPALCRLRHRGGDAVYGRAADRPQPARAARRTPACHGCRLLQRRRVPDLFRFRATVGRDLARHHHHLFDADLGDRAELAHAAANGSTGFASSR